MIRRKSSSKIMAVLLSMALFMGFAPLRTSATEMGQSPPEPVMQTGAANLVGQSGITTFSGAPDLVTTINSWNHGGAGSLTASVTGNTVTVTGEVTGANKLLSLNIDSGVTVDWQATLGHSGPTAGYCINLSGNGTFALSGDGKIVGTPAANIPLIRIGNGSLSFDVRGGEIQSQGLGTNVIQLFDNSSFNLYSGTITVTGANTNQQGSIINGTNNARINLHGGTILRDGLSNGSSSTNIKLYGNAALEMTGGCLAYTRGSAIRVESGGDCDIHISGGAIEGTGGDAINTANYPIWVDVGATGRIIVSGGNILRDTTPSTSNTNGAMLYNGVHIITGGTMTRVMGNGTTLTLPGGFNDMVMQANTQIAATALWTGSAPATYRAGTADDILTKFNAKTLGYSVRWDREAGDSGIRIVDDSNVSVLFAPVQGATVVPENAVESITVSSAADSITVKGGKLQMSATVHPSTAAIPGVDWSVSGTAATISNTGLLTATADGTVTVRATATDGTGVYGEKVITISGQSDGGGDGGSNGGDGGSNGGDGGSNGGDGGSNGGDGGSNGGDGGSNGGDGGSNGGDGGSGGGSGGSSGGSGGYYRGGSRGSRGGSGKVDKNPTSQSAAATGSPTAVTWVHTPNKDGKSSKSIGKAGVKAEDWGKLGSASFTHDTVDDSSVLVRVTVQQPNQWRRATMLSGYVKGREVDKIRAHFEKWYRNEVRVIHFDQQADWEYKVSVAAKVDLKGFDTNNLVLYSYNASANSYRQIKNPNYYIDANGYLRFETPYAGSIVISEGDLEKK